MFRIDEVQKGIFRIGNFDGYGIGFNQFLIVDEAPTLIQVDRWAWLPGRAVCQEVRPSSRGRRAAA